MSKIPKHLRRYLVTQNYEKYTPEDHAVWRFVMRELTTFLYQHAHPSYRDGIKKTGISLDKIPSLKGIDKCLQKLGWRAAGVSGFIPPAAFMELQAHGILPIATEMRRVENLDYTPSPDIVHEAAGHAPMLANKEFSRYLKRYAEVAAKAIITKKDMAQYEAIRDLSDLKEHPNATPADVAKAYERLNAANAALTETTEAMMLARMGWWTTEYGLMGDSANPKIIGAGLLSSVGESRHCLSSKVAKIKFSIECVKYTYDITNPQPQLFVAKDFNELDRGLDELSSQMAFKKAGAFGLRRALEAETVNTVQLSSGLQIGGQLKSFRVNGQSTDADDIAYLQFAGPTQLSFEDKQLTGHDKKYHVHGYGTPTGTVKKIVNLSRKTEWVLNRCLSDVKAREFFRARVRMKDRVRIEYASGVTVEGDLRKFLFKKNVLLVMTFKDCTVRLGSEVLFQPDWGMFDLGAGSKVVSVFGGPADRPAYGPTDDFVSKKIPRRKFSKDEKRKHQLYAMINKWMAGKRYTEKELLAVRDEAVVKFPDAWLIRFELYELARRKKIGASWVNDIRKDVIEIAKQTPDVEPFVRSSFEILDARP